MFTNARYVTRGIADELSPIMQVILWRLIDEMEVAEKDYLQVFELLGCSDEQLIVHKQEQPAYRREHRLKLVGASVFTGKIFVIDDTDHSTMMKASEY